MHNYTFSEEAELLLVNHSGEKVNVLYNSNPYSFQLPKVGERPPYYWNPRYEPYYPII
ncbi:hypothetical protein [Paenisporosarcina sp. TG20]|uniref:hypothetical protein n=1 Tax=Paenisporosarcina sp. TG20 TaxID=1211706 RepID=UPI0003013734|nr:hypothetical protein [Paenisporosarcina sp. TG20]